MANPTPEQNLIIALVGDLDPATGDLPLTPNDGVVAQNIGALWDRHADKAAFSQALRAAYVERDACKLVLTVLAPEVDTTPPMGGSVRLQQRVATYEARMAAAQLELERLEVKAISAGLPVMGAITAVTPVTPPNSLVPVYGPLNASDPRYSGSPYWPGRLRSWGRP